MTTVSIVLVVVLACALFAVLVWGFRRAGDGPGVIATPPDRERGTRHDAERR
jgi:hypothetical protein